MEELKQRIERLEGLLARPNQVTFLDPISQKLIQNLILKTNTTGLSLSGKGATSENQPVNELGSSSYSVLTFPDAFLQFTASTGTIYYIPVYT